MTKYYTGTESEMLALDVLITKNCGWPVEGTDKWASPRETATKGVYAIPAPQGSHGLKKEQMTKGITHNEEDVDFPVIGEEV